VRVGYVDGQYVLNPTYEQLDESTLDMILAGHKDGVNMIEVGAQEVPEHRLLPRRSQSDSRGSARSSR
jgi:polyribonucleotide nucleotidyltransferase